MKNFKLQLSTDLQQALKDRDLIAIKTIRSLISDIDNAGAVIVDNPNITLASGSIAGASEGLGSTEVPRKNISKQDIQKIVQGEINEIARVMELIKKHSPSRAKEYGKQINILKKYLRD